MSQENKYTKPELRERIKDRVMAGSKGGKPGQWSARKAQLVASEYKEAGGGYKGGKGESYIQRTEDMKQGLFNLMAIREQNRA